MIFSVLNNQFELKLFKQSEKKSVSKVIGFQSFLVNKFFNLQGLVGNLKKIENKNVYLLT